MTLGTTPARLVKFANLALRILTFGCAAVFMYILFHFRYYLTGSPVWVLQHALPGLLVALLVASEWLAAEAKITLVVMILLVSVPVYAAELFCLLWSDPKLTF